MAILTVVAILICWATVLVAAFLLWGALRMLGVLSWRVDQLEETTPTRVGRNGLRPGKKAPEFTLPDLDGNDVSLHEFAGRRVFLVFTQTGCGPCQEIIPALNRLTPARDEVQVLVVNRGDPETTRQWAQSLGVRFPVLAHQGLELSRRYEVFATPFGFLIDERGVIRSKGIVNGKQAIGYVLTETPRTRGREHTQTDPLEEASQTSAELASHLF